MHNVRQLKLRYLATDVMELGMKERHLKVTVEPCAHFATVRVCLSVELLQVAQCSVRCQLTKSQISGETINVKSSSRLHRNYTFAPQKEKPASN
jgi:hypothetical protein